MKTLIRHKILTIMVEDDYVRFDIDYLANKLNIEGNNLRHYLKDMQNNGLIKIEHSCYRITEYGKTVYVMAEPIINKLNEYSNHTDILNKIIEINKVDLKYPKPELIKKLAIIGACTIYHNSMPNKTSRIVNAFKNLIGR